MLRSFARVVALVAAFPLTSLAQDKADQLAADDSVAVSSRNAIINFGQVWIQDANVTLPVNFCTRTIKQVETEDGETKEESNTKCYDSTEWRAEMTEAWVQRQAAKHANVLVTPRYDQLFITPSGLKLITPTSDMNVDLDLISNPPPYVLPSYRAFKENLLRTLNELAPAIARAQGVLNSERYLELPDRERGTFMAEQAKSAGIPLSVFERLTQSTYAFTVYIPRVSGSITVTKVVEEGEATYYSTDLEAPLNTKLIVFRFDGEQFNIDLETRYGRSFGSRLGQSLAGRSNSRSSSPPTISDAQGLFRRTFNASLRDSYITIGNELKKDRRFALTAPISEGPTGFTMPIGRKEGIRARHPFRIYRTVDGKERPMGRVRIDTIGDNCTEAKPSALTRRGGSIEDFDLAVEEPYGGSYWGLGGGASTLPPNLKTRGVQLNAHYISDLAYVSNSTGLNDWYLYVSGAIGGYSNSVAMAEGTLGFERRYFLPNSPLYLGIQPRIGFQGWFESDDREARIVTGDLLATLGFDIGLSSNIQVYAGIRGGIPLKNTLMTDDSPGLQAMAGAMISFSLGGSAGIFSTSYADAEGCKKPSRKP